MELRLKTEFIIQENNELIAAIAICFPYICSLLGFSGVSIVLSLLLITVSVFKLLTGKYQMNMTFIFLVVYVLLLFLLSFLTVNDKTATIDYLIRFLLYDIVALLIGMQYVDKEVVIRNVLIIGLLGLPRLLLYSTSNMNNSATMGLAYSWLPVLIVSMIGIMFFRKYRIIACINAGGLLLKLFTFAPRGIWVIVLSAGFLIVYQHLCKGERKGFKKARVLILLAIAFFALLFVINNLEAVISWADDFIFRLFHVRIYAIWKLKYYIQKGNVFNGRDALYTNALNIALSNPFFGKGIGYFESQNEGGYCHNLLLQAVCEKGLFMLIPILAYIIKVLYKTLYVPLNHSGTKHYWSIIVFCCGIEIFFFSSVYWIYVPFWFFLGSIIGEREGVWSLLRDFRILENCLT